jgi:hypothetical protein
MQKLRTVNPEMMAALFRTVLQCLGVGFATWGFMTEEDWAAYSGPVFTFLVTAWGMYARRDSALVSSAAGVPAVQKIVAPSMPAANDWKVPKVTPTVLALAMLLPALGLALGACVQARPINPSVAVVEPAPGTPMPTRLDVRVAQTSEQVARYCGFVKVAIGMAAAFVVEARHQQIIDQASLAVNAYCEAPPTDVRTAIITLANIYSSVMAVRTQRI